MHHDDDNDDDTTGMTIAAGLGTKYSLQDWMWSLLRCSGLEKINVG